MIVIEPYAFIPPDSGGKNRTLHTIEELKKYTQLDLKLFYENQLVKAKTETYIRKMKIPVNFFPVRPKHLFSFLTSGLPYWFSDWDSQPLIKSLKNLPHRVLIEYTQLLYLVDYLPKNSLKIFTAYDISTVSFWRRLTKETNLLKKVLGFFRWLEIYVYERKYLPRYDLVVAVSNHDALTLKRFFGIKKIIIIPNGVQGLHFLPQRPKDDCLNLGFIGSVSHPPNQQAIDFLTQKIAPELEKRAIKYRLVILGEKPKKSDHYIKYLGYVDDLADFYAQIDILVAPIFAGSGSRIKILESLSYGRPVVTTKIGAEGIDLTSASLKIIDPREQYQPQSWVKEICNIKWDEDSVKKQLLPLTWENIYAINYTKLLG
jgi:polysaccharide biosynthesis protein PslH